ncbi:hypothetical protein H5410_004168 [Solanum commersonii]|uniref:Uncharacterized protein n=1 Tax=Solanum commersonii TaxID=4109 RepID=A0A9J6B770_SOLCO|nr:hypothetical protein H5410_004168 [Solanum commersonii]
MYLINRGEARHPNVKKQKEKGDFDPTVRNTSFPETTHLFPHPLRRRRAPDDKQSTNSFESTEDFERLLFGDSMGNRPSSNSFFRKLDRVEKAYDTSGLGSTFSSGKDLVY